MTITETIPTYVTITVATLPIPASIDGLHAAGQRIIGIALFIAERDCKGRWRFARRAHVIPAGESESTLLEWAATRLPGEAMLIGWNVDHCLVPALLDAAATAPPTVAHRFVTRIHHLLIGGVVDMALGRGGAGAPMLAEIAADMAICAPGWNADAVSSAWAIGAVDQLRRDLADEAVAIWRVFVRSAGATGLEVETATVAWILRRQRMNAVVGADRSP